MTYHPVAGRPAIEMREEHIAPLVEGFKKAFALRRAAGFAGVSRYHVKKWLEIGEADLHEEKDTLYAQLFAKVAAVLTEIASEILDKLKTAPNNSGALQWILEKCLREDYGTDSEEHKELLALYEKLFESYKRLADKQPQGAISNGTAMDSSSNG